MCCDVFSPAAPAAAWQPCLGSSPGPCTPPEHCTHSHTSYCSCLLEDALQYLIHFCQQKKGTDNPNCTKQGLLTCC